MIWFRVIKSAYNVSFPLANYQHRHVDNEMLRQGLLDNNLSSWCASMRATTTARVEVHDVGRQYNGKTITHCALRWSPLRGSLDNRGVEVNGPVLTT